MRMKRAPVLTDSATLDAGKTSTRTWRLVNALVSVRQPQAALVEKRSPRNGDIGAPCMGLSDGVGGGFFGTCNPDVAWCAQKLKAHDVASWVRAILASVLLLRVKGRPAAWRSSVRMDLKWKFVRAVSTALAQAPASVPDRPALTSTSEKMLRQYRFRPHWRLPRQLLRHLRTAVCEPLRALGDTCTASYECDTGACLEGVCEVYSYCDGEE